MSGIWNINTAYNVNNRRVSTKLSFEVGENFSARVVNVDKITGDVLLKLLDGWQFPATIENLDGVLIDELIRLQVDGFEDGKLNLKIVKNNEGSQEKGKDSIDTFIKEKSMNLSKEDYEILEKMVKHQIPLTKENISTAKTIIDFTKKIKDNPSEEEVFIQKYLLSKNVIIGSEEGNKISDTLRKFFNQLKTINKNDLFTLMENNIDLNEENIKSFNSVFKDTATIYKEIKNIGEQILGKNNIIDKLSPKPVIMQENMDKIISGDKNFTKNNGSANSQNGNALTYKNIDNNDSIKANINTPVGLVDKEPNDIAKQNSVNSNNNKNFGDGKIADNNATKNPNSTDASSKSSAMEVNIDDDNADNLLKGTSHSATLKADSSTLKHNTIEEIAKQIKDQVNMKTEDMKDIIKTIIEKKSNMGDETHNNIMQFVNKNMNDFKVFNTMSNSYYYLDLPVSLNERNYECKLMIKDERKQGKKIDTTNVKIAASVNTINMGVVDAYINVNNYNMDIDIKCEDQWLKILEKSKTKILENLTDIGYNIYVSFKERKEEMNISTCREFFQDNGIGMINTKV